jgi:hypothetical protein
MKISEWFSGTLKEANLTCYPTDNELEFQIEPLEDWYANGQTVDITPYVDTDTIEVSRPKLYNEVTFEWQTSKSFMNEAFLEFHNRPYGNLKEVFPNYDGGTYSVKLPFETMLFNNFDDVNNNLQVGYCLTKAPDYKPYIPKPVKLYLYNQPKTVAFYFDDGTSTSQLTTYMPFGQETYHNTTDYTINFGEETSSLDLQTKVNSLYMTYYKPYLLNLFDSKTRIVKLQTMMPISMLTNLTLDDAVIVRDKKYRINDMTTNLNTGLVKLVLISDWVRERGRKFLPEIPQVGGVVTLPIKPTKKGGWIDIDAPIETQFITSNPTLPATNEDEQNWTITIPANSTGYSRYQTIVYRGYNSDGSQVWERTVIIDQSGSEGFLLTESGGYLLQESLDKIQL